MEHTVNPNFIEVQEKSKKLYQSDVIAYIIEKCGDDACDPQAIKIIEKYAEQCKREAEEQVIRGVMSKELVESERILKIATLKLNFYDLEAGALDDIYKGLSMLPESPEGDVCRNRVRSALLDFRRELKIRQEEQESQEGWVEIENCLNWVFNQLIKMQALYIARDTVSADKD
jgi:hypothetical protein